MRKFLRRNWYWGVYLLFGFLFAVTTPSDIGLFWLGLCFVIWFVLAGITVRVIEAIKEK